MAILFMARQTRRDLSQRRYWPQPESVLAKLRKALPGFRTFKPFIQRFASTTHAVAQVLEILKTQGLASVYVDLRGKYLVNVIIQFGQRKIQNAGP
jgi:hypothetical protein